MKTDSGKRHVAIVAATLTGNRGAEAMLVSTVEQLSQRLPETTFHILTYRPKADLEEGLRPPDCLIHSATPWQVVFNWLPQSILGRLFPTWIRPTAETDRAGFRELANVDAVIDLAGVSFMDGRLRFLPYNILTLFPFLLHGVPAFKLSQAIGPFDQKLNRWLASLVLPACSRIYARGRRTHEHLSALPGIQDSLRMAPDTAFQLSPTPAPKPVSQRSVDIGIVPSSLVIARQPEMIHQLVSLIGNLQKEGKKIRLIAHSWQNNDRPRNNDLPAIRAILAALPNPEGIEVVGPSLNVRQLKEAISECRLVLTSRFHGMIAALDTATPVLVVGWGHKYREVMESFALDRFDLILDGCNASELEARVRKTFDQTETISRTIQESLEEVRNQCSQSFDEVADLITIGNSCTQPAGTFFQLIRFTLSSGTLLFLKLIFTATFLALGLPALLAYLLVQIVVVFASYLMHSRITFGSRLCVPSFTRFLKTVLGFKILDYLIFSVLFKFFDVQALACVVLATLVLFILRFPAIRFALRAGKMPQK